MTREAAPLITAALIMRDEEQHLDDCLTSLDGVVDEIVIVDTGSTDASVDIAEAHGARVLHRAWDGDFSTPRNLCLDHARGEWILYIDADERLRPVDRADVAERLRDAPEIGFRILLHPVVRSTPYYEYRLWRSDPRIRFEGVIHEKILPSLRAAGAADGRPISNCDLLALDHVGYEGDQERKHRRNLPLLQRQLQRKPNNIFNWHHLARVWEGLGDPRRAEEALERAVQVELARRKPTAAGAMAWADLVRHRHERGDDVTSLLAEGLERWPSNWLLVWIQGEVHRDAQRYPEAIACFRRLLEVDRAALPAAGVAYPDRIFGAYAHAALGLCYFRLGQYADAARAYAAAEALEPETEEYRVKRLLAESRVSRR